MVTCLIYYYNKVCQYFEYLLNAVNKISYTHFMYKVHPVIHFCCQSTHLFNIFKCVFAHVLYAEMLTLEYKEWCIRTINVLCRVELDSRCQRTSARPRRKIQQQIGPYTRHNKDHSRPPAAPAPPDCFTEAYFTFGYLSLMITTRSSDFTMRLGSFMEARRPCAQ